MNASIDRALVAQHFDALYWTADAGHLSLLHLPARVRVTRPRQAAIALKTWLWPA